MQFYNHHVAGFHIGKTRYFFKSLEFRVQTLKNFNEEKYDLIQSDFCLNRQQSLLILADFQLIQAKTD